MITFRSFDRFNSWIPVPLRAQVVNSFRFADKRNLSVMTNRRFLLAERPPARRFRNSAVSPLNYAENTPSAGSSPISQRNQHDLLSSKQPNQLHFCSQAQDELKEQGREGSVLEQRVAV